MSASRVPFHPPQRVVPARILTGSGWLRARLHLPRLGSFAEFLAHAAPFLPLTRVALPGTEEEVPFLALRRIAALLVLPACAEGALLLEPRAEGAVSRHVRCVLPAGSVSGLLDLPPGTRVSDHVGVHPGFLTLREADVGPARTRVPLLFVNASALIAVAEGPPRLPRRGDAPQVLRMANDNRKNRPQEAPAPERGAANQEEREIGKQRVPAGPIEQRPGEEPIGNGATNAPAAFPPHN